MDWSSSLIAAIIAYFVAVLETTWVVNSFKISSSVSSHKISKAVLTSMIVGFSLAVLGFISPFLLIAPEKAKGLMNLGGALFGIGIPLFVQWRAEKLKKDERSNFVFETKKMLKKLIIIGLVAFVIWWIFF